MSPGALVLHGFTGTPSSVQGLADALTAAGFEVSLPLLPGHGTTIEEMTATGWADWTRAAEDAYLDLAGQGRPVVVAGLSMGGALACWLAVRHPDVAGLVCVNPAVEPAAENFLDILKGLLDAGITVVPGGVSPDIARPGVTERAYGAAPVGPALSFMEGLAELAPRLGEVTCPLLLLSSTRDHVVPPSNSDLLEDRVTGPVERVALENSFHVATLDWDAEEIERRAVAFALAVSAGAP